MRRNIFNLTLLATSIVPVAAFAQASNNEADIKHFPETLSTENYWSAERMRNAKPMPEPEISDYEIQKLQEEAQSVTDSSTSEVLIIEPSPAKTNIDGSIPAKPALERADVNQRPFWNAGKLYFSKSDGDYVCSAQFVGHKRVLMTAAHCLRDKKTGDWYKNFMFYQRYEDGSSWNDSFKIGCAAVRNDWITGDDSWNWSKDYGFLTTFLDSNAGWLGMKSGIPYSSWTSIGYPSNYGDGKYLMKADGHMGEKLSHGVIRMDKNPMGPGSSGGAWIAELTTPTAEGNYAVGLNSYGNSGYPESMFGPYFDGQVFDLHKAIKEQCRIY